MVRIKGIGNYYGGLYIKKEVNNYYWIIENYNSDMGGIDDWTEIPKELYDHLLLHKE